mmetsp:Transcript_40716/g.161388  ORF Transcript_40716/g.161388 Transcript_40716/m.161388 type:complete len:94 (-) Transcript_40716:1212-1493(-)
MRGKSEHLIQSPIEHDSMKYSAKKRRTGHICSLILFKFLPKSKALRRSCGQMLDLKSLFWDYWLFHNVPIDIVLSRRAEPSLISEKQSTRSKN